MFAEELVARRQLAAQVVPFNPEVRFMIEEI
jgi:hypothetical protein